MTDYCYWCPMCGWVEDSSSPRYTCVNRCDHGYHRSFGVNGTQVEPRGDRDALALALELTKLLEQQVPTSREDFDNFLDVADWLRDQVIQALREAQR